MTEDTGLTVLPRMSQDWFVQWQFLPLLPVGGVVVGPQVSSITTVACERSSLLGGTEGVGVGGRGGGSGVVVVV